MPEEIPVKIAQNETLPGAAPVVIIGPNGSGKTRYGLEMARWNQANMVAALRNFVLPADVNMRSLQQAAVDLQNNLNNRTNQPWEISNEINFLFSKLMAEDATAAIRFRAQYGVDKSVTPEVTKIMQLSRLWTGVFPGRNITFEGNTPSVRSDISGASYPAQQMSDGERVALYLAARVLDSTSKVIIVDEPEAHFHSRLSSRFWSQLEKLRSDCRFVYITHDLPFALSRTDATFILVMPNLAPQVVDLDKGIPDELSEALLAAASFSIHAKRIVFCEGSESSDDYALYSVWFRGEDTVVVPVGSSEKVVQCKYAFVDNHITVGVQAMAIIDRDYWPDHYLQSLASDIFVLDVHEVENLMCLRAVVSAVAKHLGSGEDVDSLYQTFIDWARDQITGGLLNKQVSERYKRRCEHEFRLAVNSLTVSGDINEMERNHIEELNPDKWATKPEVVFAEERAMILRRGMPRVEKQLRRGGKYGRRVRAAPL